MKVYVAYEWDNCDRDKINLKVFKNEENAKHFCESQPHVKYVAYYYEELEAEGFE